MIFGAWKRRESTPGVRTRVDAFDACVFSDRMTLGLGGKQVRSDATINRYAKEISRVLAIECCMDLDAVQILDGQDACLDEAELLHHRFEGTAGAPSRCGMRSAAP